MKKSIPLIIHQSIQPILENHVDLIEPIISKGLLLHLIDKDEGSDFYFKISKQEVQNGFLKYFVTLKPTNDVNTDANSFWLPILEVVVYLNRWIKIIETYNATHTFYDDPILKEYQDTFYNDFDIIDADAAIKPFNIQQQLFIDSYLENSKKRIEGLKAGAGDDRINELTDLIQEAEKIQNTLTKESKKKIIKRLSKFWAKAQKIGLDVVKEIFVDVAAELTKKLITGS